MSKAPRLVVPADELLPEIEDLMASLPTAEELASDSNSAIAWRGRALATVSAWSALKGSALRGLLESIDTNFDPGDRPRAMRAIRTLLHEGRHANLLSAGNSVGSSAMSAGSVFEYFSELTKRLQLASSDVFFVDPYLDATFAQRYLPQIRTGVSIRLLTSAKYAPKVLPAAELFAAQSGGAVELREATFHDRLVFIDRSEGFQSGASFKDGAAKAPTSLIEIVDTLPAMLQQYEELWKTGAVHR